MDCLQKTLMGAPSGKTTVGPACVKPKGTPCRSSVGKPTEKWIYWGPKEQNCHGLFMRSPTQLPHGMTVGFLCPHNYSLCSHMRMFAGKQQYKKLTTNHANKSQHLMCGCNTTTGEKNCRTDFTRESFLTAAVCGVNAALI